MAGEAIVSIRDRKWTVTIADAPWELARGLGGLPELAPGTGMLFDTGWEQIVQVTTAPMLFPLDVAFLSQSLVVTEVCHNIEPGYIVTSTLPARYFLEVNAGELQGIVSGDRASVEFLPSEEIVVTVPDWMSTLTGFLGFVVMGVFMVVIARDFVRGALEPPKKSPVLYGPRGERLFPETKPGLAAKILSGLRGKEEPYRAYVRYPKDRAAFVTVGAIVGGHYSWNPAGFSVWVDAWERNPEWPADHILGIRELRRPRSFEATEEGVKKALEYIEQEFPGFTESAWVSKSIPVYVAQELGILKLEHLPQTTRKSLSQWFEKGVEAGKTDGWMDVENTLKETARDHPEIRDAHELVWTDIDLWEQTDHFNILYGSKMWQDARGDIDVYVDLKSEFWEGYLAGRREIGKDIYQIAKDLVKSPVEFLPGTASKRGEVLYRVNLAAPKHVEEVVLEDNTAVLRRYRKPVVRFKPTEQQRRRILRGKGYLHIFSGQVSERSPSVKVLRFLRPESRRWARVNSEVYQKLGVQYDPFAFEMTVPESSWAAVARDLERSSLRKGEDYIEVLPSAERGHGKLSGDFIVRRDRLGNIIITYTLDVGKSVLLQTEADKKLVCDVLTTEEREDLDEGWRIVIADTEPRASILEELWEGAERQELLPEARYRGLAVMPRLPPEAREDPLFVEYIRDLVRLGEEISDEEAGRMWQAWQKKEEKSIRLPQTISLPGDYELWGTDGSRARLWRSHRVWCLQTIRLGGQPYEGSVFEYPTKAEAVKALKERGYELLFPSRTPAVAPSRPRHPYPGKDNELEFLPDSPEVLAQTIEAIGYREKLDTAFQEAIARAKGLK